MATPAAFLDRDGVINVDSGYVGCWEEFAYLPDAIDGLILLQKLGFKLVVVTNQSGIARGYYTEKDFLRLTQTMKEDLSSRGVELSAVYYCPYLADADREPYRFESALRKPEPGMLLLRLRSMISICLDPLWLETRCRIWSPPSAPQCHIVSM